MKMMQKENKVLSLAQKKEVFVKEQFEKKFGKKNLVTFLENRPREDDIYYEHWPHIWANVAPYIFSPRDENIYEIFERFAVPLESTVRGQLPVEGFVAFLVNNKVPGVTVYPLHKGYLVKYGNGNGNRFCVLDRRATDSPERYPNPEEFNVRDLVWELCVKHWDKTKELLLERLKPVAEEFKRNCEKAFDNSIAVTMDGKGISEADIVIVIKEDGKDVVFDGELFLGNKITKPVQTIETFWASDMGEVQRVMAKVISGKLEVAKVLPQNCMWNSYLIIKEKYLPFVPENSGTIVKEIVPR